MSLSPREAKVRGFGVSATPYFVLLVFSTSYGNFPCNFLKRKNLNLKVSTLALFSGLYAEKGRVWLRIIGRKYRNLLSQETVLHTVLAMGDCRGRVPVVLKREP